MSTDILKPPLYNFLGHPVMPDELTDDQRAVLAWPYDILLMRLAEAKGDHDVTTEGVLEWLKGRGWWAEIMSPFDPDSLYWAGVTPHSTSGWNGRPDHQVGDVTLRGALWRAILLMLIQERQPAVEGQL